MNPILYNYLLLFGYGVVGALMMSLALGILIRVWDWITPINEWEEIKKGNMAVAVVTGAVIIAFAIVIAAAVAPGV